MKKINFLTLGIIAVLCFSACYNIHRPPISNGPEPPAHDGVFVNDDKSDSLIFNGDGKSVRWVISKELASATNLPQKATGTYVFLFWHGQTRYDEAEYLQLTSGDYSYKFRIEGKARELDIELMSPINAKKTLSFMKTNILVK